MNRQGLWSLPTIDISAKLQACEIELQYTKEELMKRKAEADSYKQLVTDRDKQIKSFLCRQCEVEMIHKELVLEYDKHVACLKEEIRDIKRSHENLVGKYMESQKKSSQLIKKKSYSSELVNENVAKKLLDHEIEPQRVEVTRSNAIETVEKTLINHYSYLNDEIMKFSLTAADDKFNLHHLEDNVQRYMKVVEDTQNRLLKLNQELKSLSSGKLTPAYNEKLREEEISKRKAWIDVNWSDILDSEISTEELEAEENERLEEVEDRIKSYLTILSKLMEQAVKKRS